MMSPEKLRRRTCPCRSDQHFTPKTKSAHAFSDSQNRRCFSTSSDVALATRASPRVTLLNPIAP